MKKNLNEQLERIKQVMGLIKEQDDIMSNFLNSNNFRNCRGIRLTSRSGEGDATDEPGPGWSRRAQKQLEKQMRKEEEAELKNFNKQNGLNLDMEYYTVLKDDALRVKNFNATGYYNDIFDEQGKPFTKNMTQKIVNNIQSLFSDISIWYFYWRDIFGKKTPSLMDLYKYVESIGGKEKFKEIVDANYNVGEYRTRLNNAVEAFETELKSKFPFEKPSGKTPFYFIWDEGGVKKFRYFNTYEEWNLSSQIVKEEGNQSTGKETNGAATAGSTSFSTQPKKGNATPLLFK